MEIRTGRYAMMKDGRTILIENIDGETFSGTVISSAGTPKVEAKIDEIDHIAKEKATMHKA